MMNTNSDNELTEMYLKAIDVYSDPVILDRIAGYAAPHLRQAVAESPVASPLTLDRLAGDEDGWVRYAVARNPITPLETLDHLSNDPHDEVRDAARNNTAPLINTLKLAIECIEYVQTLDTPISGWGVRNAALVKLKKALDGASSR
jgi:hypothetical protein